MPFALIPEGFELVKVTKAQEQAVQKYYNQERINSLLENPAIPLAIAAASLTGIAGLKLKDYLVSLQLNEKVDDFIDNTTDKVKDIIIDPFVKGFHSTRSITMRCARILTQILEQVTNSPTKSSDCFQTQVFVKKIKNVCLKQMTCA